MPQGDDCRMGAVGDAEFAALESISEETEEK
jgi:hypothetical protein